MPCCACSPGLFPLFAPPPPLLPPPPPFPPILLTPSSWESVLRSLDNGAAGLARYAGPGGWNDPDMLEVGNGDLTVAQQRSHFALWALVKAPLLIGADLAVLSRTSLAILTAKEVRCGAVHRRCCCCCCCWLAAAAGCCWLLLLAAAAGCCWLLLAAAALFFIPRLHFESMTLL